MREKLINPKKLKLRKKKKKLFQKPQVNNINPSLACLKNL
jgi:hypothetical protein